MACHSSVLAWRISWTEGPGGYSAACRRSRTRLKRLRMHAHTPHACTHSACMHTLCMRAHTLKMLRNGRKQYSSGLRKEHGLLDLKEDSIIKGKVVNF